LQLQMDKRVPLRIGDLLRQAAFENPTDLGREAKRYLDSSKTVPDDFMMTLITDRITREDCLTRGWLLDGFPHNLYQANALVAAGHVPDKVIVVEVDHATVMARTEGRQIDPVTVGLYKLNPVCPIARKRLVPTLEPILSSFSSFFSFSSSSSSSSM
jgi:adenylate kinase family enzyme